MALLPVANFDESQIKLEVPVVDFDHTVTETNSQSYLQGIMSTTMAVQYIMRMSTKLILPIII